MIIATALWLSFWFLLAFADTRRELASAGIQAIFPGDQAYELARPTCATVPTSVLSGNPTHLFTVNKRFSFQPAGITYPHSPDEISKIIKIGTSNNFGIAARSGGHSFIADGVGGRDGVLVVDMKNMTRITVDPSTGGAVIETGNRLGDVALGLNNARRGLGHGSCPEVGLGGQAAYGGFGYTSRMWGLTLDAIQSINVVLSNGSIVTASSHHNPDLFWAMRGSAPSFGIATSIQVKTFPVPPSVTVFSYIWNMSAVETANSISALQAFAYTDIPPQLGIMMFLRPGSSSGQIFLELIGGWYGPVFRFNAIISPLLQRFPRNPRSSIKRGTYIQSVEELARQPLNTTSPPLAFYAKSLLTPQSSPMPDRAIEAFVNRVRDAFGSKLHLSSTFELYGGANSAVTAVASDATSYMHRDSLFLIRVTALAPNSEEPFPSDGIAFVDGIMNTIISNSPGNWDYGAYPNYADDHQNDWEFRYYGSHYGRLQSLKRIYDATNTFSFPIGIHTQYQTQQDGSPK